MVYLIIWGLCGVVAGAIYSSKGRSGALGFLAGLLLGPIGLILALATPADKAGQEQKAVSSGEMKKCPKCAELVKADALICRFCAHEFAPPRELAPGEIAKITRGNAVVCSACGGAVRAESTICKHCKATFNVGEVTKVSG